MLKDPASIALAAFFSFLGVGISVYQVREIIWKLQPWVLFGLDPDGAEAAVLPCRPAAAADTMPPAQLHGACVPGAADLC